MTNRSKLDAWNKSALAEIARQEEFMAEFEVSEGAPQLRDASTARSGALDGEERTK